MVGETCPRLWPLHLPKFGEAGDLLTRNSCLMDDGQWHQSAFGPGPIVFRAFSAVIDLCVVSCHRSSCRSPSGDEHAKGSEAALRPR
jgi:hypothetical protein